MSRKRSGAPVRDVGSSFRGHYRTTPPESRSYGGAATGRRPRHVPPRGALVDSEIVHRAARDGPRAPREDERILAGPERRPGTDPEQSALISLGFDIDPVFGSYALLPFWVVEPA